MPPKAIQFTAAEKSIMSSADPVRLKREFAGLTSHWRHGRWLSASNRYRLNCVKKIDVDTKPPGKLRHGELASYIAASSIVHCMDGWSYLARAMEAELSGDFSAARHLAYYAELRAAMSILASSGVGVFNDNHFAVDATRQCVSIKNKVGTHPFVWAALEHWASEPPATDLILRVIQPGGKALSEWLSHFPPTAGGGFRAQIANKWLIDWGLDLRRLANDRTARNESSYRPTSFTQRSHPTLDQTLDFISNFWLAHEPSELNPFKELDRHLLRRSLSIAFKNNQSHNFSPRRAPTQYSRFIKSMLHGVLPTADDFNETTWEKFLSYRQQPEENLLITLAETPDPPSSSFYHLQIIARATLLLRIATGAARENLQSLSSTDVENLSFWWKPIGENRGFWNAGTAPKPFSELWADIESTLSQLHLWRTGGGESKKALITDAADVVYSLSSCEKIALWSLGL